MAHIFLATLGVRPEAITIALDLLRDRYPFTEAVIIHTDPQRPPIADAYSDVLSVLRQDYDRLHVRAHEIRRSNGSPMLDITDQDGAMDYFRSVYSLLAQYKSQLHTLHLMIASGRKAMSVYCTVAAALVFGSADRLWTVLSPDELVEQRGIFHIPPEMRAGVQVVELPLLPARVIPGSLPADLLARPELLFERRGGLRDGFINLLTPQERILAETLAQNRYSSNEKIAALLNKSLRTVENQLYAIYDKMNSYFDFAEQINDKRQALIDIMLGRL